MLRPMRVHSAANALCDLLSKVACWETKAVSGPRRHGPVKNVGKITSSVNHSTKDGPEQSQRFIKAAREAEADETEVGADRAFKKVVPEAKGKSP